MSADIEWPDPPTGVEWLEMATLLSMLIVLVLVVYLGGWDAGVRANGGYVNPVLESGEQLTPPSWATTGLYASSGLALICAVGEIVIKRYIAGSADDGADAQAETDGHQSTEAD